MIRNQNNIIKKNHVRINSRTRIATINSLSSKDRHSQELTTVSHRPLYYHSKSHHKKKHHEYHEGVTKIKLHWNYVKIYLSKHTLIKIKGGAQTASAFLAGKVKNVYVGLAAAAVTGVVTTISPKGGIWYNYNYFIPQDKWGWQ